MTWEETFSLTKCSVCVDVDVPENSEESFTRRCDKNKENYVKVSATLCKNTLKVGLVPETDHEDNVLNFQERGKIIFHNYSKHTQ